MISAVIAMTLLALAFGALLGYASVRFRVEGDPIVDQVDAILPQTQCGQCGFPGCRPYAEAMVAGEAEINRCPPGGEPTIHALADLLGREPPAGEDGAVEHVRKVAYVVEEECIGCTLCLQACPVDAIVGAAKQLHQVLEAECTGCELCLPPCPVECIHMHPVEQGLRDWKWPYPATPSGLRPAA